MFDVNIISTGSKGNCVVVDEVIMCDAGLTKKRISDSEYDLEKLQVLLISHRHADHTNLPFIRWALKTNVEVHIPQDVLNMLIDENRCDVMTYVNKNLFIHNPANKYNLEIPNISANDENKPDTKQIQLSVHPQKHYDIVNYAFVLETLDATHERLLYSTDLDTIEPTDVGPGLVELGMFNTIILEGNFDEVWLRDYINIAISSVDSDMDASVMTDKDLDHWVRENYRQLPKSISSGMFRAVQNMRHLSKQQARLFVRNHLIPGGVYYEVHRSSMFYERPSDWTN